MTRKRSRNRPVAGWLATFGLAAGIIAYTFDSGFVFWLFCLASLAVMGWVLLRAP